MRPFACIRRGLSGFRSAIHSTIHSTIAGLERRLARLHKWQSSTRAAWLRKGPPLHCCVFRPGVETLEGRIVPSFTSQIYNADDSGGVVSSGLNLTIVVGQGLDLTANVSNSPSANSTTPTGTLEATLTSTTLMPTTYNVGTVSLTAGSTGVGDGELATTNLPSATGTYNLGFIYSGDANFAGTTLSSVATITIASTPSGTPTDRAPGNESSLLPIPTGDGLAANVGIAGTGVNYATGGLVVFRQDLSSLGFGTPWGQTWSYSSETGFADGQSGAGAMGQAPHLARLNGDSSIAAVVGGGSAYFWDLYGVGGGTATYHPRFGIDATLTHDTTNGWFLINANGTTLKFYDFSLGTPSGRAGELISVTDAYGDATSVTSWASGGQPAEVERTDGTVTEAFVSTYYSSGVNAGLLDTVTQEVDRGSGFATVASSAYTYYGSGLSSNGSAGDLEFVTVEDPSSNLLSAAYYRYDSFNHLKAVFGTAGYEQLVAAYGLGSLVSESDATVDPYASLSVTYNGSGQVSQVGVPNPDVSGQQVFTSYSYGSFASGQLDPNMYQQETIETLPDGNENLVFTNGFGQIMTKVYEDTTTSQQWITDNRFDSAGRVLFTASPSAVTGYSTLYADLVNYNGSTATDVSSSSGLVTQYTYGSSTTATTSTTGDVAGYLKDVSISQGLTGTAVPQEDFTYELHTASSATIATLASTTQYRNDNGTGGETTSYSDSFYSGTNAVESVTTTLPTITTGENGPNSATTVTTFFSQFGRPIWEQNQNGFFNYTQYDVATGAIVETIQDVDTSITTDFSNKPTGWTTITGGGLNLVTSYTVDSLGRVTEKVTPGGVITYVVYLDASNEVRTYSGWNSTTHVPTGPTMVMIDDMIDGYTETLTMTATPTVSSGVPTGAESIADVQSLSRTFTTVGGLATEKDDYFALGGLTYTSGTLGTSGVNYYATLYSYDDDGNLNRMVSPEGTIYRTVFNGQGEPVSKWVGTSDTVTGTWSPTNAGGMVKVESLVYDGGSVGDSTMTSVTMYPGGGAANRVDDFFFDWRDREVAEKDGVSTTESDGINRPLTVTTYDNLNEVTETQLYSGDSVTPSISSGVLSLPGGTSSDLQAQTVTSFDELGQVYQTQVYSVDPTSGSVSSYALTTNYYRDGDGNVIATSAPGGLWIKNTFDGANRQVFQYQTDGGGGTSYSAASSISSDVVLSQVHTLDNADGLVYETITSDRYDNATGSGALLPTTSGVSARISYSGEYYDLGDRPVASVNVGTNGGTAWTMPTSAPSGSSTVLVTTGPTRILSIAPCS